MTNDGTVFRTVVEPESSTGSENAITFEDSTRATVCKTHPLPPIPTTDMPRVTTTYDEVHELPSYFDATITKDHLDAMGHMNVMWYTHFFSQGMGGLFAHVGLDWDTVLQHQRGTFALEGHTHYLSECREHDAVQVFARVVGRSEKRYHVVQYITNETKRSVAAALELVGAHVDLSIRRMAPMPSDVASAFDRLIEAHAKLDWPAPLSGIMAP